MFNVENVTVFAFVLSRITGCIFLNPIFGRRNIPSTVKTGLALALTFILISFSSPVIPPIESVIEYVALLGKEFIIGYVIGFVVSLFFYVISFGGELIDLQMGISMAKIYDPQSNTSLSITASIFNVLFMCLFFASNGHIDLIRIFLTSESVIPYGGAVIFNGLTPAVLEIFCQCTVLAVKLALPIMAIEILIEMGVGILMKAIPQINVFVVNIQAKLLIGIILLYILFIPFSEFLGNLAALMFDAVERVALTMAK